MRHIRFSLLTALFVLFTFSIVTYTSCKEDKCKNLVCANGGSCAEGVCKCPTGYTGTVCENAPVVDPCANVVCQNGGTCSNGNCTCATGYEGTNCQTEVRTKLLKNWSAIDVETNGTPFNYSTPIVAGSTITGIKITEFADSYWTNDIVATINGNTITIPHQDPDSDGYQVEGTGIFNPANGKITWTYTVQNPLGTILHYTGTWQ